jgi:flagellar hook-length control protein FliK
MALSQAAVSKLSELNVVPPPTPAAPIAAATLAAPVSLPTAPFNDAALATPAATKLSENFPTLEIATRDANAPQPGPTGPASSNTGANAPTNPSQQAKIMAALFDAEGIEITFSQTADSVSTKPAPALANGMITQIGAVMSAEGQAKTSNSSTPSTFGIAASTAAPNVNLTQTAMAVAATPMIQAAGDEPQPKFIAPTDGLMVNTVGSTTSSHASYASVTEAVSTGKAPHATPPAFDQVAVQVAKAAAEGIDKINIKLKPATLGQIEVQLEIASDGRIHAVIAADKPETLDLLQRDARALERALGDAGLRTDSGSLSFNLRGQGEQNGGTGRGFADFNGGVAEPATNDSLFLGNADRIGAYLNSRAAAGGVDIRV